MPEIDDDRSGFLAVQGLWLYEAEELARLWAAREFLSALPEWDGVPRLQDWLDASAAPAPQPRHP